MTDISKEPSIKVHGTNPPPLCPHYTPGQPPSVVPLRLIAMTTEEVPHPSAHGPRPLKRVPHPSAHGPRPLKRVPHPSAHGPRPLKRVPHPSAHGPRPLKRVLHPSAHDPRPLKRIPHTQSQTISCTPPGKLLALAPSNKYLLTEKTLLPSYFSKRSFSLPPDLPPLNHVFTCTILPWGE